MKRGMLAIALLLGITVAGFAQQPSDSALKGKDKHHKNNTGAAAREIKTPEERARLFTDALDKQLNLSEAQEKQIYSIQLENAKKIEAMRQQHQAGDKQKQSENRAHFGEMDKIQSILTDEQRVTYQKLREERMKKMTEYRAQHHSGTNASGRDSTQSRKFRTKKIK